MALILKTSREKIKLKEFFIAEIVHIEFAYWFLNPSSGIRLINIEKCQAQINSQEVIVLPKKSLI